MVSWYWRGGRGGGGGGWRREAMVGIEGNWEGVVGLEGWDGENDGGGGGGEFGVRMWARKSLFLGSAFAAGESGVCGFEVDDEVEVCLRLPSVP